MSQTFHIKKMLFKGRASSLMSCLLLLPVAFLASCAFDKGEPDYQGYPASVGPIFLSKCATAGCHQTASASASAGLDLSSWENLFKGSRNNSTVIPFRSDHSFLVHSVNTGHHPGPVLYPTMPLNKPPLSMSEVDNIMSWIDGGAPDAKGAVRWSGPERRKIYVANQGCDYITVFDADSRLIMQVIDVGNTNGTEAPHDMHVSPDGNYLYISFFACSILQKYRTSDGVKVGEIDLSTMSWHALAISGNGKYAICSHFDGNGKVALIDLETMSLLYNYQGYGAFIFPHGCAISNDGKLAYITALEGNFLYRMDLSDPSDPGITQIVLQPGEPPMVTGMYKPYEIDFSPDHSKYYVTCQGTREVRVFQSSNDSLLKVIPTSGVPQLISFSHSRPYAFITCIEDAASTSTQSSVNVINTSSDALIATVNPGYQPRGLAVDDANDCVWIANRNVSGLGVAPHHTTLCAGLIGYVTIIDMRTLQVVPGWKTEVSVDPYCVAVRK